MISNPHGFDGGERESETYNEGYQDRDKIPMVLIHKVNNSSLALR
jgi:hypothetical protein